MEVVLSACRMGDDGNADSRDLMVIEALSAASATSCPTLSLQGAQDGIDLFVDTQLGQEVSYRGPFERKVLQSCGHFLQRERPDPVADQVLALPTAG